LISKSNPTDADALLQALTAARAPLTPQELADRLHVADDARPAFNTELEELERAGRVVPTAPACCWSLPAPTSFQARCRAIATALDS
jgi:hypothetical protein